MIHLFWLSVIFYMKFPRYNSSIRKRFHRVRK